MSHARLVFDGTVDQLREQFGEGQRSLESMYLSVTAQADSLAHTTDPHNAGERERVAR
jgi:hypothetical protein